MRRTRFNVRGREVATAGGGGCTNADIHRASDNRFSWCLPGMPANTIPTATLVVVAVAFAVVVDAVSIKTGLEKGCMGGEVRGVLGREEGESLGASYDRHEVLLRIHV